jgi:hypothetical protein
MIETTIRLFYHTVSLEDVRVSCERYRTLALRE